MKSAAPVMDGMEALAIALGEIGDVSSKLEEQIKAVGYGMTFKGAVNYYTNLPSSASVGDVYIVLYTGSSGNKPLRAVYAYGSSGGSYQWIPVSTGVYVDNTTLVLK